MNKFVNYIFWPATAGLIFATVLLQMPRLANIVPGLSAYGPQPMVSQTSTPASMSYSGAIKKALPAVVSINSQQVVERTVQGYINNSFPANIDFLQQSNSLGSGVIISSDGFIITSYHVLFNPDVLYQDITVSLNDGNSYEARPVMIDEPNDLALIKIDADNLPFMDMAAANRLEVGDIVLAIGNPRNIGQSVSFGIISALLRKDDSFVIQTDAAINPGNSGGALINVSGSLIGINSTIVSGSGGSEGIGFATPASKAMNLLKEYLESEPSGYLGVDSSPLTVTDGMEVFGTEIQGFLLNRVTNNGSADRAGLRAGDVITAIDSRKIIIENFEDIVAAIESISKLNPGDNILVEVYRNGEFISLPTTLGVGEPDVYCPPPNYDCPEQADIQDVLDRLEVEDLNKFNPRRIQ